MGKVYHPISNHQWVAILNGSNYFLNQSIIPLIISLIIIKIIDSIKKAIIAIKTISIY
jgi:hypothetical protein